MSDKPEINSLIKRSEAESERIRQTKIGKMFLNICVMGTQAIRVLFSLDKRLSDMEARLEGSEFAINRYLNSDCTIQIITTKTINSDTEIT